MMAPSALVTAVFSRIHDVVVWIALIGAASYLTLAAIGGLNAWSPAPFWDMWEGYLDFYRRIEAGDFSAWFAQHNEHRIFLARLLFWTDIAWFGGAGVFLLFLNYAFAAFSAFLLLLCLRAEIGKTLRREFALMAAAIVGLSYSWIQHENFTWAFQSQFFLAHNLPLLAFLLLTRSWATGAGQAYFAGALVAGAAAAATMANGVLTLPMMALLSLAGGAPKWRTGLIAVVAGAVLLLYFRDYQSPVHHVSFFASIAREPLEVLQFALAYLGAPAGWIMRTGSLEAALAGGAVFLGLVAWSIVRDAKARQKAPHRLALYAFIFYIAATAAATAAARYNFGQEAAIASRYTTPSLMAWIAVLILFARPIMAHFPSRPILAAAVPIGLLLLFGPNQVTALDPQIEIKFEKRLAALAVELGAHDAAQISALYPLTARTLEIGQWASARDVSIFAAPDIRDARERIGGPLGERPARDCTGALERFES
ncbi:MAG: hypothetical protein WD076_06295, partial [Parvularculaceae bacterium]